MKHLNPPGWPQPRGYSNGIMAKGTGVFVAGMIGWDERGEFPEGFVDQLAQALKNTVAVLAEADATSADIVRMTWFVCDLEAYRNNLKEIGRVYREIIGKNFPTMAVVGVAGLVEKRALLEIETTAVIAKKRRN